VTARRSVLFVHQNFPGQFPHIARALVARGDRVAAIGSSTARNMPGVDVRKWTLDRGTTPGMFEPAVRAEADLIRADAAARAAARLKADGFTPDVIVGNPGWGETLHLKKIWPHAKVALLVEYWYVDEGGDVGFDPEFGGPVDLATRLSLNARNLSQALACTLADLIVCPTPFQASLFPDEIRKRIVIHHEGIDLARAARLPFKKVRLPDGALLDGTRPVVTFIARTLEPLRGFHSFMRALPAVMAAHPMVEVVVIGNDQQNGYGAAPPAGRTWKQFMLDEVSGRIDPVRLHFTGGIEHREMMQLLLLSTAHVYLTYPFTLSWSLLEAMACGCLVIASDTAPVRDAIRNGKTGVLCDFFDSEAIATEITRALNEPEAFAAIRQAASASAMECFDAQRHGTPEWLGYIDGLM
jgi:glycosyltransferase involved in cell wall biosynthesis